MKKISATSSNPLQFTKILLKKSYGWLLFLAILWLVWLLAKIVWLFLAPPVAPNLKPVPLIPSQPMQVNNNALDIFARPQPQVQQLPPPDIKVVGVTVASNDKFSFAILNANNQIRSYRIGDIIDNSVYQLSEVKLNYIVLKDMNGQETKIEFGKPFELDQSSANRSKNAQNSTLTNNTISNRTPTPMPMPNGGGQMNVAPDMSALNNGNSSANDNNSPLNSAINALEKDPAGYLTQMGVTASGEGYTVTDSMPAMIKDRLGLQSGDKVISINGQNVGQNPSQDAQTLRDVQQAGHAQIQVQRGDQVITIRQSF